MPSENLPFFSADGTDAARRLWSGARERLLTWRRSRLGLRGLSLYLLSAPLAIAALVALAGGNLAAFAGSLGALALIVSGARLNRRFLLERLVAPRRRYSRSARFPYQPAAVALVATGTALAAYAVVGHGVLVSALYAALAACGSYLAYRLPRPIVVTASPAMPQEITDPTLSRTLEQAERQLLAIDTAALAVGNAELEQRLQRIAQQGRAVLDLLAQRPADLYRARRFFNLHLNGAERVAVQYAKTHRLVRSRVLESNFRNVLTQIEAAFQRQYQGLLQHEAMDLDIQIEVLRKQLQREGIA